jgi:ribosomal protein S18 acetylase RimI-like enzyme
MDSNKIEFIVCNLKNTEHQQAFIQLMNIYRNDPMGGVGSMSDELALKLINDLKNHPTFMGFLVKSGEEYIAMANCFTGYSTFKAKPLLNIHDFVVSPAWRGQKVGEFLLNHIASFLREKGYCRINLEVRHDNPGAMNLYKRVGFKECNPPMYFWEKYL